jgi:hypothetical protein
MANTATQFLYNTTFTTELVDDSAVYFTPKIGLDLDGYPVITAHSYKAVLFASRQSGAWVKTTLTTEPSDCAWQSNAAYKYNGILTIGLMTVPDYYGSFPIVAKWYDGSWHEDRVWTRHKYAGWDSSRASLWVNSLGHLYLFTDLPNYANEYDIYYNTGDGWKYDSNKTSKHAADMCMCADNTIHILYENGYYRYRDANGVWSALEYTGQTFPKAIVAKSKDVVAIVNTGGLITGKYGSWKPPIIDSGDVSGQGNAWYPGAKTFNQ